jgi:hypothetical protein
MFEEVALITLIHSEARSGPRRLLIVIRPVEGSTEDKPGNAVDLYQFLENTGTDVVSLEGPAELSDEVRVVMEQERHSCEGSQPLVMLEQAAIAVIIKGGIHPVDLARVFSRIQSLFENKECLPCLIFCVSADPHHHGYAAADDEKSHIEKLLFLRWFETCSFSCAGAGEEDCLNVGQDPVQVPPKAATINSAVFFKRRDEVYDETSWSLYCRH